eukprot:CAMPEP_0179867762 /NCGR_PEP_ID=MMETSP0982-20121206/18387_1 /TAXON_ID=483367 /ORGANISM="non described non described, Strain CCMP 2436" /LENGTH=189 /DNA_ID=CAMNT_0021757231 /DNA_START=1326 /DNA_END=1892 /DNA_ORIENTATION=+
MLFESAAVTAGDAGGRGEKPTAAPAEAKSSDHDDDRFCGRGGATPKPHPRGAEFTEPAAVAARDDDDDDEPPRCALRVAASWPVLDCGFDCVPTAALGAVRSANQSPKRPIDSPMDSPVVRESVGADKRAPDERAGPPGFEAPGVAAAAAPGLARIAPPVDAAEERAGPPGIFLDASSMAACSHIDSLV